MFRRISACVGALIVLTLAACQDSGPLGLDKDVEESPAFELFSGGWAAVTENGPSGFPNLVHNGGFESGTFAPEWSTLIVGPGDWDIGLKACSSSLRAMTRTCPIPGVSV